MAGARDQYLRPDEISVADSVSDYDRSINGSSDLSDSDVGSDHDLNYHHPQPRANGYPRRADGPSPGAERPLLRAEHPSLRTSVATPRADLPPPRPTRGSRPAKLRDDERVPQWLWYLSGERSRPPTAGQVRKHKQTLAAAEEKKRQRKAAASARMTDGSAKAADNEKYEGLRHTAKEVVEVGSTCFEAVRACCN